MNLALFFEGTGQGVTGKYTNVTRLKELCAEDETQKLHIESGPGTHFGAYFFGKVLGADCREILRSARRWFQQHYGAGDSVYLFGFSRGALLARKLAEWLDKLDVPVAYLGVWDTVDSALKVDIGESCPACVAWARHAVARDERRRYFKLVPMLFDRLRARSGEERVFPGVHSDIGGLYEDNHEMADVTLAWIATKAVERGLRLKPGAQLPREKDPATLPVHDSFRLVSNLWGLLGSSVRTFPRLKGQSRRTKGAT